MKHRTARAVGALVLIVIGVGVGLVTAGIGFAVVLLSPAWLR